MPSYHAVKTKGVKEHLNRDQILQLSSESIKSLSNSSDFKVSGRTNPRNNLVKYNQKNGTLIIHSSDGSRRHYSSELNRILIKKKDKVPEKEFKFHEEFYKLLREEKIEEFFFKLDKELLSNGNWVFYAYNELNWPVEIKVTNPSETKSYSRINVISSIGNDLTCKTSCNKFLKIHGEANFQYFDNQIVDWDKKAKKWEKRDIKKIISYIYSGKIPPEAPQESYKLLDYDGKVIQDCILPDKRQLHIDYYTAGDHSVNNTTINIPNAQDSCFMRVKSISITGKDDNLQNLYYFIYHPGVIDQSGGATEVYDSDGNKTIYKYSAQLRLETIERYILENNGYKKINSEQFIWGKNTESTFLSCKTIYDSQKAISSKRFIYDGKGNLIKEISYGNLSGQCQAPLVIENGFPIMNGIETFTVERTFTNDNRNLLKQQRDDNGLITSFSYQKNTDKITSKLISYKDPKYIKQRFFYEYDSDNILIKEIQDDGSTTGKDNLTNVTRRTIKVITPRQVEPYLTDSIEERCLDLNTFEEKIIRKEKYEYNENRRIHKKEIFDSNGELRYSLSYDYDEKGNIKYETDPLGREAKYRYDLNDNKEYEKDFSGKETSFEYDLCNRLIKKTIKDDSKSFVEEHEYDLKNNKILEKDIHGNIKKYEYDAFNNLTKEISPQVQDTFGDINTPTKCYKYDDLGRQIEKIDPLLNVTKTSYNAHNKPILIEYPNDTSEKYIYNLNGTLKKHINQEGLVTKYDYDYLQREKVKQIYSPTDILLREEIFEYSAFELISKKDIDGNITKYTYDGYGRKIKEELFSIDQILLSIEDFFYDELGFISKKIKGNNLVTIYTRDLLGRVEEKRRENANKKILFKIRYKYDNAGNKEFITSYVAGKKSIENRKHDIFNRLIKTTDALKNETTIQYNDFFQNDLNQKVKQIIHENALKQKTITTNDALDREKIIENKSPDGLTISLEEKFYDLNNHLTRQKSTIYNPDRSKRDVITYWHYDHMNRLDILKEAYNSKDEKTTLYSYTDMGKLKTTTKPDGVVLENEYDLLGNKTRVLSSKNDIDYQFTYNNLNQLIQINDKINETKTIRKYDVLGNLLQETLSNGLTLKSEYDLLSNRTKLIFPDSTSIQYIYDSLILKKIIRKDSSLNPLYEHTFLEYDLSGNLLKEELISNSGFIDYEIDSLEQITSVKTPYHIQKTTFDEIGRISKIEWQNFLDSTSEYKYDDLNQIIAETGKFSNNYEFDSHYNRLKKNKDIYQINDLNQVLTTNDKKFTYDKNGNPIIKKTKYGDMKYVYDSLDRLIKIEKP
ncbi:MAG: putative deoxyribonuclease RhsA, partial [Candidatus Anoxychlamydiales bacterium]|nr:putative deoxyribonuclease RhsA [Candidatus Anoxychlamydiales bacterium]